MRASEITAVGLAALALCCLATLYPAMLASRLRPAEGLRYE
jgi:lipoprotein-releasing system permease protein